MAKFDPSRVTGGTIELVRNPDGSYKSQVTGFNKIASLNLPDFTAATTTSEATTAAAEKAQENLQTQTSTAFKMPSVMQGDQDNQTNFSGDMTKEAAQTSKLLTETFKEPVEIKSPTDVFYDDFPEKKTTTAPDAVTGSPIENILNEAKVKEDDATITLSKARIRGPRDLGTTQTTTTRTPQGFDPLGAFSPRQQRDTRFQDDAGLPEPPLTDYPDLGPALGITTKTTAPDAVTEGPKKETLGITVPADRDLEADIGAQVRKDIEPIKKSSLQTFATSVKETFKDITIPSVVGTVLRTVAPPETPVQAHAKKYFNVRDDGRIAGNPNTDLYAGFNRTSAFGNLERAGEKRIETREKTIERKGYGPGDKFYDDTQKMKDQQDDYKSSKSKATASRAAPSSFRAAQEEGMESSGTDSGKIVCTAMYKTTGLEEWKKHIRVWQIFERKYLTPYHEKGYHILFKPFVKGMHRSNIIKALGAHVAKHRTQDLKHIMFNSKPSWIGRIYRKILEPICYLVGRLWR
jgi:hypothetical protein